MFSYNSRNFNQLKVHEMHSEIPQFLNNYNRSDFNSFYENCLCNEPKVEQTYKALYKSDLTEKNVPIVFEFCSWVNQGIHRNFYERRFENKINKLMFEIDQFCVPFLTQQALAPEIVSHIAEEERDVYRTFVKAIETLANNISTHQPTNRNQLYYEYFSGWVDKDKRPYLELIGELWQKFIAIDSLANKKTIENLNQKIYLSEVDRVVKIGASKLRQGITILDLLRFCAGERHTIAERLNQRPISYFGTLRWNFTLDKPVTYLLNRADFNDADHLKFAQHKNNVLIASSFSYTILHKSDYEKIKVNVPLNSDDIHSLALKESGYDEMDAKILYEDIDGERIPLTTFMVARKVSDKTIAELSHHNFWCGQPPMGFWVHSDAKYLPRVMQHVGKLYEELKNLNVANPNFYEKLGEIHGWLVHGYPCARGTAATSEMMVKAIALSFNLEIDWPAGHPDLDALTLPQIADFAKIYPSLITCRHIGDHQQKRELMTTINVIYHELKPVKHRFTNELEGWTICKEKKYSIGCPEEANQEQVIATKDKITQFIEEAFFFLGSKKSMPAVVHNFLIEARAMKFVHLDLYEPQDVYKYMIKICDDKGEFPDKVDFSSLTPLEVEQPRLQARNTYSCTTTREPNEITPLIQTLANTGFKKAILSTSNELTTRKIVYYFSYC